MAWIESHQGLGRHIKTKRFARKLGVTVPAAIGHLHLLWWWAMDNLPDGNLSEMESEDIADEMMFDGDSENLVDALIESGFVDVIDEQNFIHDWHDYIGKLVEKREKDAERKRLERAKTPKKKVVRRTSNGRNKDDPCDGAGNRTVPNRTKPEPKDIKTYTPEFDEFWNVYPRKIGKMECFPTWEKIIASGEQPSLIIQCADNYAKDCLSKQTEETFIKHPKTFLNKERYKDYKIIALGGGNSGYVSGNSGSVQQYTEPEEDYSRFVFKGPV